MTRFVFLLAAMPILAAVDVSFDIDLGKDNQAISPFIYGTDTDHLGPGEGVTLRRSGGNRLTGYNWENNASNAGKDWYQSSDNLMGGGNVAGQSMVDFHEQSLKNGAASLLTLPAAGYVARDKNGTVSPAETAPSKRWTKVVFQKGRPFAYPPDTSDDAVYSDEFVDFMVKKYGDAGSARGVRFYDIDNEPGLWPDTHPRLHPAKPTCVELAQKTAQLAAAVKKVDAKAEILGGVFFGYSDYQSLQGAPDWDSIQAQSKKTARPYDWYLDYFLDYLSRASKQEGRRLIDALDLHWYSEAVGDHRVNDDSALTLKDQIARMQAPRSLWDTTYAESSWISKWATPRQPVTNWSNPTPGPVNLLPRVFASIQKFFPGTRLTISEYNYGGNPHVSGGLATADFLGIIGRMGVYAANLWELKDGVAYSAAAFRLYRNYDGKGSAYGSLAVGAVASDRGNASVYAAYDPGGSELHIIALNKSFTDAIKGTFRIASPQALTQGRAWGFDATGAAISEKAAPAVSGGMFTYTLPPLSAYHFVLKTAGALPAAAVWPGRRAAARRPGPMRADPRGAYLSDGRELDFSGGIAPMETPFWFREK